MQQLVLFLPFCFGHVNTGLAAKSEGNNLDSYQNIASLKKKCVIIYGNSGSECPGFGTNKEENAFALILERHLDQLSNPSQQILVGKTSQEKVLSQFIQNERFQFS